MEETTMIEVPQPILEMLEERFQEINLLTMQKQIAEQRAREILKTFAVTQGVDKYDFDGKNLIVTPDGNEKEE